MKIRQAYQAGRFYPGNPGELHKMIKDLMLQAETHKIKGIRTGIVPHAGIVYSGLTASHFYKSLEGNYERVIVIAPSHYFFSQYIILPESEIWETPLGNLKIDTETVHMITDDTIIVNEQMHIEEHAAEVQMPFIRYVFGNTVAVIPIIMGSQHLDAIEHLGNALLRIMDNKTLIIASSDLYHGNIYDEALKTDEETMEHIMNDDYIRFQEFISKSHSACGGSCIGTVKKISESLGLKIQKLHHTTSSDITGDFTGYTVGYGAFAGGNNAE